MRAGRAEPSVAEVALHDSPRIDSLAAEVRSRLADAGHNKFIAAQVLAAALLDESVNLADARYTVNMAARRRLGHRVGSHLLAEMPDRAPELADSCAERRRATTSLAVAGQHFAQEAVLRGWVAPAVEDR